MGALSAVSQLAAPALARRIGLINTMAFTHIPASLCVIAVAFAPNVQVAFALLVVRALLSNMDVPARWGLAKLNGVPTLLVINTDGTLVNATTADALADARALSPQMISDFLARYAK